MSATSALADALSAVGGPPASRAGRAAGVGVLPEPSTGMASTGSDNFCRCYLDANARSDALLVAFSGHFPDAVSKGYEVPFEFKRFLGRHPLGMHTLFLRDPSMSWYLLGVDGVGASVDEVAGFIRAERERLNARRLFTLGSSMGGYAAVLMGHLLQADAVLAFGPQVYLDQATRRQEGVGTYSYDASLAQLEHKVNACGRERYLKLTNFLPFRIGQAYIHVGGKESGDINQARGFNDQPNVKFVVWPGGNHMVVKSLRDAGKLSPLLQKCFAAAADPTSGEGAEGESAEGLRGRGNELVKEGRYAEAAEAYTAALRAGAGPSHHLVLANRSLCLLKMGLPEEAWHDADAAHCLEPTYSKALYRRALCEVERKYIASALQSLAAARKLDPEDRALSQLQARLQKEAAASPGGPSADKPFAAYCE